MQSIPGVHNANQWGSYEQIDKKCADLHQSEHLDLRVEDVVSLLVRACYQRAPARGPSGMSSDRKTRGKAERSLLEVSQCTRRKHEVALGLPLRADALALRPRGARSSPPRHQPVCLGDPGADLLICCHSAVTGRHRRRRAAREARRPCGSGAGMPCSSSREVRLVGHRKPMPSAVVRWNEASNSRSSASERVLLSSSHSEI